MEKTLNAPINLEQGTFEYHVEAENFLCEHLGKEYVDYQKDFFILHFPKILYKQQVDPGYSRYIHDFYVRVSSKSNISGFEATREKYAVFKDYVHGHLQSSGSCGFSTFCQGANLAFLLNTWCKTEGPEKLVALRLMIYYLINTFLPYETNGPYRSLSKYYQQLNGLPEDLKESYWEIINVVLDDDSKIKSITLETSFKTDQVDAEHLVLNTQEFLQKLQQSEKIILHEEPSNYYFKNEPIKIKIIENYEYFKEIKGKKGNKQYKLGSGYYHQIRALLHSEQCTYTAFSDFTIQA